MTVNELIQQRIDLIRQERIDHAYEHGYHVNDPAGVYLTGDGEQRFRDIDHLQYYERLTGHLEELRLLARRITR